MLWRMAVGAVLIPGSPGGLPHPGLMVADGCSGCQGGVAADLGRIFGRFGWRRYASARRPAGLTDAGRRRDDGLIADQPIGDAAGVAAAALVRYAGPAYRPSAYPAYQHHAYHGYQHYAHPDYRHLAYHAYPHHAYPGEPGPERRDIDDEEEPSCNSVCL